VAHHHTARVAREAPRRFRGNVRAPLEDGLARLIRVCQHRSIDVDHDLVSLSRGAGIDPVVQRRFREQGERIRPLLRHRRRIRRRISQTVGACFTSPLLVQRLSRRRQRAHEQGADFRRQPSPEHHRAVLVLVDVQRAARVLAFGLPGLCVPVDAPPAPHDALDVGSRAGASHPE
jgi:hypothetical protein